MKIHIPNSAFIGNIEPFLQQIDFANPERLDISTNQSWVAVHPLVLSMIAALGCSLRPEDISIKGNAPESIRKLEQAGLLSFLKIAPGDAADGQASLKTIIPITQVTSTEALFDFIAEKISLLGIKPVHFNIIRYILSELTRNVLEHSKSKDGAIICVQYHRKNNVIRIGIADRGIGILHSLNQSHCPLSDLEALQLALTPGITGVTKKEGGSGYNAGGGLFFIKSLAKLGNNFFFIHSGNAAYKLLKNNSKKLYGDPRKDHHSERDDLPFWQGTLTGIDFCLDEPRELAELLDLIRITYNKAIRERKDLTAKKARFL